MPLNTRRENSNSNHRLIFMGSFDIRIDYFWAVQYGFATTPNYEYFCGCSHWYINDTANFRPATQTVARFQAAGGASYSASAAVPGLAFVHIYDAAINNYSGTQIMRRNTVAELIPLLRMEARQDYNTSVGYGIGSIMHETGSSNGTTSGATVATTRYKINTGNGSVSFTDPSFGTPDGALLVVGGDIIRGIEVIIPPTAWQGHTGFVVVAYGFVSNKKYSALTDSFNDITLKCTCTMVSDHTHQLTLHPVPVQQESGTALTTDARLVAGQNTVRLDTGANTVKIDGTTNTVKIDGTTNTVKIDGTTNTVRISTAANTVKLDSATNTVKLDSTTNTVKLDSTANTVKVDSAANTVKLDSAVNVVKIDSLTNTVKLDASANTVKIDTVSNTVKLDPLNSAVSLLPDQELSAFVYTPLEGPGLRVAPADAAFNVFVDGGTITPVIPDGEPPLRVLPQGGHTSVYAGAPLAVTTRAEEVDAEGELVMVDTDFSVNPRGVVPVSAPIPLPVTTQIEGLDEEGLPVDVDTNFSTNVRGVAAVANVVPLSVTAPLTAPLMVATPPDFFMPVVNPVFPGLGHDGLRPRPVPLITEPMRDFSRAEEPYVTQIFSGLSTNPDGSENTGLSISGTVNVNLVSTSIPALAQTPIPVDISPNGVLNTVRTVPVDTWNE